MFPGNSKKLGFALFIMAGVIGITGPALAGLAYIPPAAGVPGPIAGAGLPFLAVAGGVYWLVRRARSRNRE